MPRIRLHTDDAVLDATAEIVLAEGSRAASMNAIAAASGAPVGSIYHRYASRDEVVVALWERAAVASMRPTCRPRFPVPTPLLGAVRRHLAAGHDVPEGLEGEIAGAARALLDPDREERMG